MLQDCTCGYCRLHIGHLKNSVVICGIQVGPVAMMGLLALG